LKRGSLIKIVQRKKKSGCLMPKGIEQPLALLYNLIATKNQQQKQ